MNSALPPEAPRLPALDLEQLAKDVAELKVLIRVILGVVYAGISFASFMALWKLPQFEKIFEDMLGPPNKLPELTRVVLEWGRLGGGLLAPAVLSGVIVTGFVILGSARSVRVAGLGFVACAIPLLLHMMVCWSATFLPLIEIIKGLGSGAQ